MAGSSTSTAASAWRTILAREKSHILGQIMHAGQEQGKTTVGLILIAKIWIGNFTIASSVLSIGAQHVNPFAGFRKLSQQLRFILEVHGKNGVGLRDHLRGKRLGTVIAEIESQLPSRNLGSLMSFPAWGGMNAS
jgi:hypothetical protein